MTGETSGRGRVLYYIALDLSFCMNIYAVSALINVATSLILGLLVLSADRKAFLNKVFAGFAFSVTFWSYSYFNWQIAFDAGSALFWSHMLMAGAIFITPIYFHFVSHYLHIRSLPSVIIGYSGAILFSIINWTPYYISGISAKAGFLFWPDAGPLFLPFLVWWIFYAAYPVVLLVKAFAVDGIDIVGIRYLLAGTIIGYGGGITNYFLWYGIPVLPFGNVSASIYLACVAYVTMRSKLFNMKVIATELLTFSLWLFLFARLLFAESTQAQVLDGALLTVTLLIGVLLIRSVDREVEQREKIERLSEEKSEFMTFASHEIRNPITAMRGYASLIVDGTVDHASPEVKAVAQKILIGGNDVLNLIAQFLSKSKMELGQISYNSAAFDFGAAASSIADGYVPHAELRGLTLEKKIDASHQYIIKADEGKVKEVIGNLIDNSLKYTVHGGVTVAVERHGVAVRLTISDTGVGIAPETLPHLFKKFSRADAQKVNLLGTGVGLYLAKTFIEAMGGRIWAESEGKDKGSRFILEFPAVA